MKTITFEGNEYEVEDWVKYVARDEDGDICAFENKPFMYRNYWSTDNVGKVHRMGAELDDWENSLIEV